MSLMGCIKILKPHLNGLHINILLATKLHAIPPGSDAQAIKLCPSSIVAKFKQLFKFNFNSRSSPQN